MQGDQLNVTSVFEHLIGNTDFSPIAGAPYNERCHNYVLCSNDVDPIVGVPYDFNQSGFVDAPYAAPNPRLGIRSVEQRVYRGRFANNEYLGASLQAFRDKRARLYAVVNDQTELTKRIRKNLVKYLDSFYKLIDDPRDVEKKIYGKCI